MDSWAHCHRLGGLHRLTNRSPVRSSPCATIVTTIGSYQGPYDDEAVQSRAGRLKALVWFWLIDETLSANLVYQSDYEIGSTIPSGEANEDHDMMMVIPW